jgi:hypothetical protein
MFGLCLHGMLTAEYDCHKQDRQFTYKLTQMLFRPTIVAGEKQ